MEERLWMIGAFVTSMTTSALLTVLIFHYLQSRSRLALAFSVFICGLMFHLIHQIILQNPGFRLFGTDSAVGILFFGTAGAGLTVFGFPNIAYIMIRQNSIQEMKTAFACLGCLAAGLTLAGVIFSRFQLIVYARVLEGVVALASAVTVIAARGCILLDHHRRLALLVAGIILAAAVTTGIRMFSPLIPHIGHIDQNWIQLTAMLTLELVVIAAAGRWLIRTVKLHKELLNPLAVSEYGLSRREQDIIREISKGKSNEEIGMILYISISTVKNHIYHIYGKTGSHNRVELLNAVMNKSDG
jgi:DNA-binding CsgD family transcriptional regulator